MEPEIHSTQVNSAPEETQVSAPVEQTQETPEQVDSVATDANENGGKKEYTDLERLQWKMDKKIAKEVGKRKEMEGQLQEMMNFVRTVQPMIPQANDEPQFEQYTSPKDYYSALARYEAKKAVEGHRQTQQQQVQAKQQNVSFEQGWAQKVEAKKAIYPDYVEAITESDTDFDAIDRIAPDVMEAVKESDVGVDMAYYLAKNPEYANRLTHMTPAGRQREIGKLELKLESGPTSANKASVNAPKPTAPATSAPKGDVRMAVTDPKKMSNDQYADWLLRSVGKKK